MFFPPLMNRLLISFIQPRRNMRLVFAHGYTRLIIMFAPEQHSHSVSLHTQTTDMGSAVRLSLLGLLLCTQLGRAPARSLRTADQVSEADIQRLLHGVMEQLGIARPRVEYPAHQATNIVGPQSIQGKEESDAGMKAAAYIFILKRKKKLLSSAYCSHNSNNNN